MLFRPLLAAALLAGSSPALAFAQDATSGGQVPRPSMSPALVPTPVSAGAVARPQALPCPECNPKKQFWQAFGELMIVQAVPFSINHFVRDAEWADVSPTTWLRNLENPWVWDNNKFVNNQFSHPYHGAFYYNAGRANGYNFWASSLFALGGSLMWEEMFEVWAPAPNDWLNTGLGGITIGESLHKLSSLLLDNTKTGAARIWREIGAFAINPVRGFDRLVDGKMNDVSANPPDWRPSKVQAHFDLGGRFIEGEGNSPSVIGDLQLWYGDQVEDVTKKPFSVIRGELELASNNKDATSGGTINTLYFRGNLGGKVLDAEGSSHHSVAALMRYEYYNSKVLEYGSQGFLGGLVSRFGGQQPGSFHLDTEVLAEFAPIAAVRSDYYETAEGRDYDYGLGLGGLAEARLIWPGDGMLRFRVRSLWQPTLSGFNGYHTQTMAVAEGRYYLGGRIGVGGSATYYKRYSDYDDFANVSVDGTQFKAFVTYAFPRWDER